MFKSLDFITRIFLFLALIWLGISLITIVIISIIKTFFKELYKLIKNSFINKK